MNRLITAVTIVLLPLTAALADPNGSYRQEPEAGYRFEGDRLVMPNGQQVSIGSEGKGSGDTKYAIREIYGLTGPDRAMTRTIFTTPDGQRYQVGYRLEGNTLLFPSGAKHSLTKASPDEAAATLKETYGLVGGGSGPLVRTKW